MATGIFRTLLLALTGSGILLLGADADGGKPFVQASQLVSRVQKDLRHSVDLARSTQKERVRDENVEHHLAEFDRQLRQDHFDKGKLDAAIDDLKNVVKNNSLDPQDRDALAADLNDLRKLRDSR